VLRSLPLLRLARPPDTSLTRAAVMGSSSRIIVGKENAAGAEAPVPRGGKKVPDGCLPSSAYC
jgi:hypothetical protein